MDHTGKKKYNNCQNVFLMDAVESRIILYTTAVVYQYLQLNSMGEEKIKYW